MSEPIVKAYRFALRTSPAHERALRRHSGGLRWVWNAGLAELLRGFAAGEKYPGYAALCKQLTGWRNAPETAWLAEGPVQAQQQTLRRLDVAYRLFMKGQLRRPRFKRRGEEPCLRIPKATDFELDQAGGRLRCPKLGWVRLRLSQPVEGRIRNLSIRRERARWYASIQVEHVCDAQPIDAPPSLGIDLGVAVLAATSDGELIEPARAMARADRRLRRYQRIVARRKRGSKRCAKMKARVARIHAQIARRRKHWLHTVTTRLADAHPVLVIEDLRLANMTASARGTLEAPGRGVRQKAGLNRALLDAAFGRLRHMLEYKCDWRGGEVIAVNPAYTSRTCRRCSCEDARNRASRERFECVACGHAEHADIHAAQNILAAGHAAWHGRREPPVRSFVEGPVQSGRPVKRAPTEGGRERDS
jgi:putative transposase